MSWPSNTMEPDVESTMRSTVWTVLVFPHPDSPTIASTSPASTVSEIPSTARISGPRLNRPRPE